MSAVKVRPRVRFVKEEGEEVRPIPGFPRYYVTSHGRVLYERKSVKDGLYVRYLSLTPKGRFVALLARDGVKYGRGVAPLVLEVFKGSRPSPRHECCHGDGVRANNHIDNLRWDTPEANWEDRKRHGRARSWSKLSDVQAAAVRQSPEPTKVLAKQLGVSTVTINNIRAGKIFRNAAAGWVEAR